jgi:hypothetical protein
VSMGRSARPSLLKGDRREWSRTDQEAVTSRPAR